MADRKSLNIKQERNLMAAYESRRRVQVNKKEKHNYCRYDLL